MITADKLTWYFHRLRAMGPEEIAGRVMEKARSWTERSAMDSLEDFQLGMPQETYPLLHDRKNAPTELTTTIAEECTRIRQGEWLLYGWKNIAVGTPPQWGRDYLRNADAPLNVDATRLDQRRLPSGADARNIWEINRWSELTRLTQNAWLNQCPEDARLAQEWLLDWCTANPVGHGINWTSPLEVALRLINFCWLDALVRACNNPELTAIQDELAQAIVPSHAWWVWRHKSFGSSANNHLLGELAALVVAARRWPSLMRITSCAEKVWQSLESELLRQFAEDGGNKEQALHYHLFAWEMGWQAYLAMEMPDSPALDRLREAAFFYTQISEGNGCWEYGDSDDAHITPLVGSRSKSSQEWRGWFAGDSEGRSLNFWLGNPPRLKNKESATDWLTFPQTGLAVCRHEAWVVRSDASPLGFGSIAAHGHLDALHTSLWFGETAVVIDPGTGSYFGDRSLREQLASWEMHNAPVPVQGRQFPKRMGPFLWANHHEPPVLDIVENRCEMRFSCEGPFIKRSVQASDGKVEVHDEICGRHAHRVIWQFAPGWKIRQLNEEDWLLEHPNGLHLRMTLQPANALRVELLTRQVSAHFGKTEPAQALQIEFSERLLTRWQKA